MDAFAYDCILIWKNMKYKQPYKGMEISKGGESIGNFPMFPNEKKEEVDEMYESKVVIEKT